MLTIEFRDTQNNFIKQWPNWPSELIPTIGDTVLLHYGYVNEIEEKHKVVDRIIDGTNSKKIICIID